jgi:hypothetical protein
MSHRYDSAGRKTCGDPDAIFMALLLMPYALLRYAFDCMRGRG